jgi:hypothetical protein
VTRLALVQAPLPLAAPPPHESTRPLEPGEAASLDRQIAAVANPELREALGRLGRRIIGSAE